VYTHVNVSLSDVYICRCCGITTWYWTLHMPCSAACMHLWLPCQGSSNEHDSIQWFLWMFPLPTERYRQPYRYANSLVLILFLVIIGDTVKTGERGSVLCFPYTVENPTGPPQTHKQTCIQARNASEGDEPVSTNMELPYCCTYYWGWKYKFQMS